jgi:hypothetical protein
MGGKWDGAVGKRKRQGAGKGMKVGVEVDGGRHSAMEKGLERSGGTVDSKGNFSKDVR